MAGIVILVMPPGNMEQIIQMIYVPNGVFTSWAFVEATLGLTTHVISRIYHATTTCSCIIIDIHIYHKVNQEHNSTLLYCFSSIVLIVDNFSTSIFPTETDSPEYITQILYNQL